MEITAKRLRDLRLKLKLSQATLAKRLGITQPSLNRYEHDQTLVPDKVFLAYADYFDVSLDYIFGRTDNPQGTQYEYRPKLFRDKFSNDKEWSEFVEACFNPESPMYERLKSMMLQMAGGDLK
jgi:transcriptional regulator with XRE-family HTH domain